MKQQTKQKKKKVGRDATYEEAFKIAVAKEYFKGELGYMKLAAKYKLPDANTVRYFVNWYKAKYDLAASTIIVSGAAKPSGNPQTEPAAESTSSALNQTVLLKELEEAKLKITALETMISIAKTDLGIDILKKAGAKQSKS